MKMANLVVAGHYLGGVYVVFMTVFCRKPSNYDFLLIFFHKKFPLFDSIFLTN
jgi:hypothetical protein